MSDIETKSYRYLRLTIVSLLIGLGVAVLHQTRRQDFLILGSISAYYYTPVQGIFVGVLMAAGVCMIALKGTTEMEDILLNFAGMAAAVVAIVPTTRGEDFETAVRACRQHAGPFLTEQASYDDLDCPTVEALAAATRANVENNMTGLLVIGFLVLLVGVVFAWLDLTWGVLVSRTYLWGLGISIVLWGIAWVGLWVFTDAFIFYTHHAAAILLFICIFVVTVANALRRDVRESSLRLVFAGRSAALRHLRRALLTWPLGSYAWVAWAMVAAVVVAGGMFVRGVITLFWLEVVLASLFLVFWLVQTVDLLRDEIAGQRQKGRIAQPRPASEVVLAGGATDSGAATDGGGWTDSGGWTAVGGGGDGGGADDGAHYCFARD